MSPRISTREAYTAELSLNLFARRRQVAAHLIDIANETGLFFEWSGFIGRTELIRAAQMADEIEAARKAGNKVTETAFMSQQEEFKEE